MAVRSTWAQLKTQIANRNRESELFTASQYDNGIPYWDATDIEKLLYEISCQLLREIPDNELMAMGSAAVTTGNFTTGATQPLTMIRVIGARGKINALDPKYTPVLYLNPVEYYQFRQDAPNTLLQRYSILNGQIRTNMAELRLTYVFEPSLADFQNDLSILPPGYDEARIDWVHKMMQAEDFMPGGRL